MIREKFVPRVKSCTRGVYSGTFSGMTIDRSIVGGHQIAEEFPFVSGVHVWHRHVEMELKDSPYLTTHLQHRTKVQVIAHFTRSKLGDFSGILHQDTFSHLHLNLSLVNASGTISGEISNKNLTQTFEILVAGAPSVFNHQIKLLSVSCFLGALDVTLWPESGKNLSISKMVPCRMDNIRTFHSDFDKSSSIEVKALYDCLVCTTSWMYWLDPSHWLEASWPQTRLIILLIMITFGVFFLALICHLFKLFTSCFCRPICMKESVK